MAEISTTVRGLDENTYRLFRGKCVQKKIMTGKAITEALKLWLQEQKTDRFVQGIVAALDVVAVYDEGTLFREIVETANIEEVLAEIKKNGLERTKEMAKAEIGDYNRRMKKC